jgi:hypothetical protein
LLSGFSAVSNECWLRNDILMVARTKYLTVILVINCCLCKPLESLQCFSRFHKKEKAYFSWWPENNRVDISQAAQQACGTVTS